MGSPSSFLRYEQLKRKYRVFLAGLSRCQGDLYVTMMTTSCLERIGVSYGTITLLLHVVASIVLKRVSFQSVETGLSHLKLKLEIIAPYGLSSVLQSYKGVIYSWNYSA